MMEVWLVDLALFFTALGAGLIDTLVGGGGLICLPALLMVGLPPHIALGTNKFQGTFGSGSSSFQFLHKSHLHLKQIWAGFLFTILGSIIGTLSVLAIDASFLKKLLPPLLFLILCYVLLIKYLHRFSLQFDPESFYVIAPLGLFLGFYDGFLGPGVGSFWVVMLMMLTSLKIREATMRTKVFNFASNIGSLLFFALSHKIDYQIGFIMAIGQVIGAQVGAHLIIHKGSELIRPVFLVVVTIMLIVLSYQTYFK